jgi:hypothetical protein
VIVYHGTARWNLEGLLSSLPRTYPQNHLNGKRAFSTTTDFEIAALFALRKSPPSILRGDESEMGIVIEYEFSSLLGKGRKWAPAVCRGVLQDEKEIAIFNPKILEIKAVWQSENGKWVRRKRAVAS